MTSEKIIKTELKKLVGAVAHNNIPEAMKAHKTLYNIGLPAIPYLKDTLFRLKLSSETPSMVMKSASELRYVTSLVSLIQDIDEDEAKKITAQLIQNGCNAIIAQRLKSINEFTIRDYCQYDVKGVRVFEYKNIQTKYDIRAKLEKWVGNVPEDDLKEVERIYVIPKREQDYAGQYTPIYYNIKLVWDEPRTKMNPQNWFDLMFLEVVLYHEIGHHIHRHTFGQDKEQEEEADRYSRRIYFSSRPRLYKILKLVAKFINIFRRKPKFGEAV